MRIRAAVTTAFLAATVVLGGAATAVAHGGDDDHSGSAHYGACGLSAAVIHGNPLFHESCERGAIDWH
ncbi:hypothetical protein AMK16_20520 [Streptomyces sp. CB00455]|uniref:hypothetical protein n=1 Tax=Streptomyces sp. CB00455 TaxID=1703927 RepID=UPI00093AFACB|nr:hypothetical protein [Streptomyces sp. CB00455]OKK17265.1 hypothetical protein AMK16_20520 [Streptomyces sp. CB00455]